MKLEKKNFETISSLALDGFPLLKKHIDERESSCIYEEFPEIISYNILKEKKKVVGIVGYEMCKFRGEDLLYISPLEVDDSYRNRGYGTLLVESIIFQSKELDLEGVCLFCFETLASYYERLGFKKTSNIVIEGKEEILMVFKNN